MEALLADPESGGVWTIEMDGSPAGYLVFTFGYSLEFGGRFGLLDELFIEEPWRGRGIGRQAVDFAGRLCVERGWRVLRLEFFPGNRRASDLYRRSGYQTPERFLMTKWTVMLLEITKLPTAENSAIHLHPTDNVAVARVPHSTVGAELRVDGIPVVALEPIPAGHKIALRAIPAGGRVERYGQDIGRATIDIHAGRHVHTHNLAFEELKLEYQFPSGEIALPQKAASPTFQGYLREDGRAGTRNYIAVVAASNCAAHTAELIAESYRDQALPEPMSMASWPSRTARVAAMLSVPMWISCGAL